MRMNETNKEWQRVQDIPELFFEQAALDELDTQKLAMVLAVEGAAEKIARIRSENASMQNDASFLAGLASVRNAPRQSATIEIAPSRFSRPLLRAGIPLAAGLAVLLVLPFAMRGNSADASEITRPKGGSTIQSESVPGASSTQEKGKPALEIWRNTGKGAEVLSEGTKVHAGDQLQVAYLAAGKSYGMIVSIDGLKQLTLHYPDSLGKSPQLLQGSKVVLPLAYQLDDAPQFERFFFVTSTVQFDTASLWQNLRTQLLSNGERWVERGVPALPSNFSVTSVLLRK